MKRKLGPFELNQVHHCDVIKGVRELPIESVQCVITSPPYWGLRDYHVKGTYGLEKTPEEYVDKLVEVFREIKRVLRANGTLWLVIGEKWASGKGTCRNTGGGPTSLGRYAKAAGAHPVDRGNISTLRRSGLKPKDVVGLPWMVAFALRADGWWWRSPIIWAKGNSCENAGGAVRSESVKDRPTHCYDVIQLMSKEKKYLYDWTAVLEEYLTAEEAERESSVCGLREVPPGQRAQSARGKHRGVFYRHGGRNLRDVWRIGTRGYPGAHYATFPEQLVEPCMLAGTAKGDLVLDPFAGSGTVGVVAKKLEREFVGFDLNPKYVRMANRRIEKAGVKQGLLGE